MVDCYTYLTQMVFDCHDDPYLTAGSSSAFARLCGALWRKLGTSSVISHVMKKTSKTSRTDNWCIAPESVEIAQPQHQIYPPSTLLISTSISLAMTKLLLPRSSVSFLQSLLSNPFAFRYLPAG